MYISLNWLKDFIDIPKELSPENLADLLTLKSAEIEKIINEGESFNDIVVGQVVELHPHPNADKLKIAKTSVGKNTVQIICGGENLKENMYVAVALPGAKVRWHGEGDAITLEKAKIRGEESYGMICAGNEIGIKNPDEGPRDIMDLSALKPKPGTPLADLFKKNDIIFEVDNKTLTHRPDLWGHYGFAREISAIIEKKLKKITSDIKIPEKGEQIDVKIEDFNLCPRYCGLIINNIEVKESPDWLKARLKAVGHGTHNNIVDITNYIMAELGQPMHAFDKNYIKKGIIVRPAKKDEKITTLDDKKRKLTPEMLVIADHEKPVAIAGVIGGENSEINENTTSIILESANFDAASIRKTAANLGIRTDAVQRFEKSLDPKTAKLAAQRAAELILKVCPQAKIAGPITDAKKTKSFSDYPLKINLNLEKVSSKIGVKIPAKKIKKILENLHFKVSEKDKNTFEVKVPSFRATKDIEIEDDLIEEVVRLYGYDNIPASLPSLPTRLPEEFSERFKKHRVRELLSYSLGFNEIYTYSFYGESELKKCQLPEKGHIKLLNYLSEEQTHLRTSLIPNILKNIQLNVKYFDKFKIYEIGRTYKDIDQYLPLEEKIISGAIVKKEKTNQPFYKAKGAIETIFKNFNIKGFKTAEETENTPYAHPNKSLTYLTPTGQTLAKTFMIHPKISKNNELENYSIAFFEINFTELMKLPHPIKKYQPLPKFPAITIDVATIIDRQIPVEKIKNSIKCADKDLIKEINLFDIYQGKNIEKNKKSVAFSILLQAPDRTLTDDEMAKVQKRIFDNIEILGGQIRGR